jgi:pSer/pThr/pTyr-binding forkhead associated (FHA) protein
VNIIGRRTDCDVRIPQIVVSRKHCRVIDQGDKIVVQDLGSANGTFVNSERVMEAVVRAGDKLGVGQIVFTVQVDGRPVEIEPPRAVAEDARENSGSGQFDTGTRELASMDDSAGNDALADLEPLAGDMQLDDSKT